MKEKLKITFVSDIDSWINSYIPDYIKTFSSNRFIIDWVNNFEDLAYGDICFLISCSKIMPKKIIKKNNINLVIHESKLPKGKGWSPLTWQVLEGKNKIPITLLEVVEKVDSGRIFLQDDIILEGNELVEDLRIKQKDYTFKLCNAFIKDYPKILNGGNLQSGESSFYKKRSPIDSKLDVNKTIIENFNLLRVVDNNKYPAYFYLKGKKFKIKIEYY